LSALLVNTQFGIAHDVDEKNMGDLQSESRFLFVRHRGMNLGGSAEALYMNFFTEQVANLELRRRALNEH
jgi:hypothetical protein